MLTNLANNLLCYVNFAVYDNTTYLKCVNSCQNILIVDLCACEIFEKHYHLPIYIMLIFDLKIKNLTYSYYLFDIHNISR